MPITDNKTFGWNISFKQVLALIGIAVLVGATVYSGNLSVGYIAMTLVLTAFFVVVAFDIGIPSGRNGRDA
ncbi:MAG: hypothetical protein IT175_07970 [Acidobacteria bacterium]|nr:hypothetical protein [Acidobacteriota bacterium]